MSLLRSCRVARLDADIDTIIGGPTAGEAPEKIGYEEYKIGVRDAFTRYAKE